MAKLTFSVKNNGEKKFNEFQDWFCLNVTAKEKRKAEAVDFGIRVTERTCSCKYGIGTCKRTEFIKSFITIGLGDHWPGDRDNRNSLSILNKQHWARCGHPFYGGLNFRLPTCLGKVWAALRSLGSGTSALGLNDIAWGSLCRFESSLSLLTQGSVYHTRPAKLGLLFMAKLFAQIQTSCAGT